MKKYILFFLIFISSLLNAQNDEKSLIGKWYGTDNDNVTGGLEFLENGKVKLLLSGEKALLVDYSLNFETNPISLKISSNENKKSLVIYGLLKFIDINTIKLEMFPDSKAQPKFFSKNSNNQTIILKRKI